MSHVRIQGLHPSKVRFVDRLRHSAVTSPVRIQRLFQMRPFFSPDLNDGSGVPFTAHHIP